MAKESVAEIIKAYRKKKNIKQNQFAELLGITPAFLSEIESGKKQPGKQTAIKLTELTGLPLEQFIR